MNKYKSDDYKLGAVKYYLKHNDNNIERPSYLCREIKSNQSASTSAYNQTLCGMKRPNFEPLFVSTFCANLNVQRCKNN